MRSKWSRAIAIMLALVMGLTMTSAVGFAGTIGVNEQVGDPEEVNVVAFGNSMSNGYYLPDYYSANNGFSLNNNYLEEWAAEEAGYVPGDWTEEKAWTRQAAIDWRNTGKSALGRLSVAAYPWQLKKHISEKENVKVNLLPICLNGMRTDELRAYLDKTYYDEVTARERKYAQKWVDDNHYTGDAAALSNYKGFLTRLIEAYDTSLFRAGATEANDYVKTSKFIQDSIKNADVIVVDLGVNNFGSYVGYRFAAKMHMPGYETYAPNTYETLSDIEGIPEGLSTQIDSLLQTLTSNVELMKSPLVKELVDAYAYGTADCIVNHKAELDWIIKNKKPGAKVIVNGLNNSMDGFKIDTGGQTVDFGKISAKLFELVNAYMKGIDKNAGKYYYADIPADMETFITALENAESLDATLADGKYEDGRGNYGIQMLTNSFLSYLKSMKMLAVDPDELTPEQKRAVQQMLFDAVHEHGVVNFGELQKSLSNMTGAFTKIAVYVNSIIAGQPAELEEGCWNFVALYERFLLASCVGVHPNAVGCQQKTDAVNAAYDSDVTGYEETKAELMALLEEIMAMLDGTPVGEDLDELVEKINMASELFAVLEDSGITKEQLEELLVLKDRLADATDAVLDALGLTMDDLYKAAMEATEPENIQKVAEQLAKIRTIIDKLPKTEEEAKAELLRQLDNVDKALEENALGLSEELLAQLKDLNAALKEAVTSEDYSAVVQKLLPIGQKLLAIGEAVAGLPEYEAAMDEWMQANDAAIANLTDRVDALETLTTKLTAKSIRVDLKPEVTFPEHGVTVTLTWKEDADADGYLVTRDGEALEYVDEQGLMTLVDIGKEIGKAYTYTVTPYVVNREDVVVFGNEYSVVVTPEVNLAKAKITNFKKGKTSFKVSWKAVKGADSYQVSYKTGKSAKVKNVSAKKLSATVKGLKANKKYTVKVRACKLVNDTKYFGGWSKTKKFKTK